MKGGYFMIIIVVLWAFSASCKKDSAVSNSIVGKWFVTKKKSELFNKGLLLNSITKTAFTTDDFVRYFGDGTGYFSQTSLIAPSLNEFKYTLSGKALTLYNSIDNAGTPETVTNLTPVNLSIHAEFFIRDPNDPGQINDEIDDYDYTRAN